MAKREKILVVDDEQDLCEILRFNLECEGFAVETAESAEQALKMLPDGYDLILLDVMMEGMSGFRMAEKVRKEQKLQVPIVFLTAKDTENDLLTGFSLGGDDYIPKPFSIKEVTARVKAVLKRSAATPADTNRTIELGELDDRSRNQERDARQRTHPADQKGVRNPYDAGADSEQGFFAGGYSRTRLERGVLRARTHRRRAHHTAA